MAKEKPVRQQVMEAGFGAHLESYGFEKVSATQYKLEERLGTWRVVLAKGYPNDHGPDSFRDGAGFCMTGLTAFIAAFHAWQGKLEREETFYTGEHNLPGTNIKVHLSTSVLLEMFRNDDVSAYPEPPPPPRTGLMAWLLGKDRTHPIGHRQPEFVDRHPDALRGMGHREAWLIRKERSIEDFTEEFCGYWTDTIAKVIFKDRVDPWYLDRDESILKGDKSFSTERACSLWLAGRQDVVRRKFEETRERFNVSHADLVAEAYACPYNKERFAHLSEAAREKKFHEEASSTLRWQAEAAAFMAFAEHWSKEREGSQEVS